MGIDFLGCLVEGYFEPSAPFLSREIMASTMKKVISGENLADLKDFKARIDLLVRLSGSKNRQIFCKLVGVSPNTIKGAMRRLRDSKGKLSYAVARIICAHFQPCSTDWLLSGVGSDNPPREFLKPVPEPSQRGDQQGAFCEDRPTDMELQDMIFVPKLRVDILIKGGDALHVAAGTEWFGFPKCMLEPFVSSLASVRVLSVQDDFMYDLLKKDDLVLIDTDRTEITEGKIYAFIAGTALFISELKLSAKGDRIVIYPKNPDYSITDINLQAIRIIGELFWCGRMLK